MMATGCVQIYSPVRPKRSRLPMYKWENLLVGRVEMDLEAAYHAHVSCSQSSWIAFSPFPPSAASFSRKANG